MIYGFNHTLVLTRASSDANALFRKTDTAPGTNTNVPDGVVNLTNIRWMVQRVKPADVTWHMAFQELIDDLTVADASYACSSNYRKYAMLSQMITKS